MEVKLGTSKDGVVFVFTKDDDQTEWREIPGYTRYLVSNTGLVSRKWGRKRFLKLYKSKTTKGTYLAVSISKDEGGNSTFLIHRLVCLAFHGLPPAELGDKPEVNHKDGDKHNNCSSNLEWMSRSKNLHHAVREGLRYDTVRVTVVDHLEGTETLYHSITHVAEVFGLKSAKMNKIVSRHQTAKWKDRYSFIKDRSGVVKKPRHNTSYILVRCYKTRLVSLVEDATGAMDLTGVCFATILRAVKIKPYLIAGYAFQMADDKKPWPEYTLEEVEESITRYRDRKEARDKRFGVTVKNYVTGEISEFESMLDASAKLGILKGTIAYLLNAGSDRGRLFKGLYFQYTEELKPWPDFPHEYAVVSLRVKKSEYPLVKVTDHKSDTTKLYASVSEFAEETNQWATNISAFLKKHPGCRYKDRWSIEFQDYSIKLS